MSESFQGAPQPDVVASEPAQGIDRSGVSFLDPDLADELRGAMLGCEPGTRLSVRGRDDVSRQPRGRPKLSALVLSAQFRTGGRQPVGRATEQRARVCGVAMHVMTSDRCGACHRQRWHPLREKR